MAMYYVGSDDSKLYMLNASNISQKITSFTAGGQVYSSPAVANGYVYFAGGSLVYQLNASGLGNDITPPVVSIIYPVNGSTYASVIELDYSATDNVGISSCWYSLNGGATNTTISCNSNITGLTASTGSNTWIVYANDTSGNIGSARTIFTVSVSSSPPAGTPASTSSGGTTVASNGTTTQGQTSTASGTFTNITAGVPVTFYTNSSTLGITSITLTTNETVYNASINISTIPQVQKSDLQIASNGNTYQSFQITTTAVNDSIITNVSITFQVNISWFTANGLDPSNVTLYRNIGGYTKPTNNWTSLSTTLVSSDSQYYYFTAISPGFSNYTIFAGTVLCNNGESRCLLNDSQICSSNAWILSQHCQLGCNSGKCITTTGQAINFFQNLWNNVQKFVNTLPGQLQLTIGTTTYYILLVIVISGIVIVSTILIRNRRKKVWKKR